MIDTSKKLLLLSFFIFFLILTFNNFYKITLGSYSSSNIEKVKSEKVKEVIGLTKIS